jgi:4-aminobutyrate aminotransferase-like enzyme
VIGLEVLNVIERERLRDKALATSNYLITRLRELETRHALVGDVRGAGLFIGIELVADRDARTPAGREAGYIANRMRELGVLVSTDGPDHNVLKIKPPICFSVADAEVFAATFERALTETVLQRP